MAREAAHRLIAVFWEQDDRERLLRITARVHSFLQVAFRLGRQYPFPHPAMWESVLQGAFHEGAGMGVFASNLEDWLDREVWEWRSESDSRQLTPRCRTPRLAYDASG